MLKLDHGLFLNNKYEITTIIHATYIRLNHEDYNLNFHKILLVYIH